MRPGDRWVIPAGDGTVSQALNAIVRSGLEDIELAPLPYGGFVHLAAKKARVLDVIGDDAETHMRYPIAVHIDDERKPWRYADGYSGIGQLALIAASFSAPESRSNLRGRAGFAKRGRQIFQLGQQYFQHRNFSLPAHTASSSPHMQHGLTDVMLVNNRRAGGMIYFDQNFGAGYTFGVVQRDVSCIAANIPFGVMALAGRAPYDERHEFSMNFAGPIDLPVHNEGEFARLNVSTLAAHKSPDISYTTVRPRSTRQATPV